MKKLKHFFGGRLFLWILIALPFLVGCACLAVWLPRALAPLAVFERLFSFTAAVIAVRSEGLAEEKLSKLVLILLLPWTGAVFCLLLRKKAPPDREPAAAPAENAFDRIAAIAERTCGLKLVKAATAEYFSVGREFYDRLLPDLAAAKRFIWLEYYIVAQGAFFHALLEILERKAKAGLDVRLLYDDFGCSLLLPKNFKKDMAARGIKAEATRKLSPRTFNRRNHRKLAVIDGTTAYTGGINLADEYIGETVRFGHWKDTAVRVTGEPAAQLAKLFAEDAKLSELPELFPEAGEIPCVTVADGTDAERAGSAALRALVQGAKRNVYLNTPYLAPDTALLAAFKDAALAGIDVRIMIPHVPDKKGTFLVTRSYARELEKSGIAVREYTAGFLHAKSVVADGLYSFVSSYNLDFRSMYLQAECGLLVQDEKLAAELERDFLAAWETGSRVKRETGTERLGGALLRLFAPLL